MTFDETKNDISINTSFVSLDSNNELQIDIPFVQNIQYAWEQDLVQRDALLGDLRMGFFNITFRSQVVSALDLENELDKKRSRPNYADTSYQLIDQVDLADDDLLFLLRAMQTS